MCADNWTHEQGGGHGPAPKSRVCSSEPFRRKPATYPAADMRKMTLLLLRQCSELSMVASSRQTLSPSLASSVIQDSLPKSGSLGVGILWDLSTAPAGQLLSLTH
ncbi:unnamed protein product [Clonostachys rosea]|uniref:Uncharacterized protein n=1 Tax=Bionectria ochroleuca TaxID=29856 RepID=A0ABY6U4F9_BIOOC|nr:unnamed protein product [Clonostachys rosea]